MMYGATSIPYDPLKYAFPQYAMGPNIATPKYSSSFVQHRLIPGLPFAIPEPSFLITFASAEHLFRKLAFSRNKYNRAAVNDIYAWYVLHVSGPSPNPEVGKDLCMKGLPPMQQEAALIWDQRSKEFYANPEASASYGNERLWFAYQFVIATQMFWMYKDFITEGPLYKALDVGIEDGLLKKRYGLAKP